MIEIPYIISLAQKTKLERVCKKLLDKCNMEYFVCYIIFNNNQKFVLSNMFHMLIPYYCDKLYTEDFSCSDKIISGNDYYLCNQVDSVSKNLQAQLENRFSIHRGYYTIKRCPECIFIFGAIKSTKIDDSEIFYKKTHVNFNNFCVYFLDEFEELIKFNNPAYKNAIVLNDKHYRKNIIVNNKNNFKMLTKREVDILFWAAQGKTSNETSIILGISQSTVDDYRKSAINKLDCSNITHTVFEAVKLGYLGAFNKIGTLMDIPNIQNYVENKNFLKTNLHLINA